jgi:hypothetical protein
MVLPEPLIVTVPVPGVNVLPAPLVSQLPATFHAPLVMVIVPLVPPVTVMLPSVIVEAFAVKTPLVLTVRFPPPETAALLVVTVFARVKVPVMLRVTDEETIDIAEPVVIVPEIVRLFHSLLVPLARIVTVFAEPDSVTVLVPCVHVELDPLVSQLPEAEMEPEVIEIVLVAAPVIVTSLTVMDAVVPVRVPPPDTVSVAPPLTLLPLVVRVPVIEIALLMSVGLDSVIVPETVRL